MVVTQAQGTRLAYEEHGTGIPVVFIHGLTFSRSTWDPIVDRLDNRFRCIAVDLPGHGESTGLPHALNEVGRRIHALVNTLGVERPILVGHSMGAIAATMYAASFPVAGVVNVDQTLDIPPFVRLIHQLAPALRGPNFAETFEPIRQSIGIEILPEPIRSQTLATQTVRQDVVLAYWDEIIRGTADSIQSLVDEAARRIAAPYLAVFGRRLGDDERGALHARIERLELEEWPGGGHMVHLMEPDRFAHRMAAFIEEAGSAS